ncbi:ornithine carbamoyltransferase [Weissella koreensis]|uniref:ornithine carbamoyltransferase n=1 Tax=Weissella koreensis TaxID=165096 RepID=UPI0022BA70AC|nr:ornithine carbamoyltransferase [Weissella koreensis]MCZ9311137.1 ornithine carbamoyltransferase [Weissella koreensis]
MTNYDVLRGMNGRSFLKEIDFTPAELQELINLSIDLRDELETQKSGGATVTKYLHDKNVILLFSKTSTRTRLSFEFGADELGANTVYIDPNSSQFGKKESVADSAKVFAGMADGIEYRGFAQSDMEAMAENAVDTKGRKKPVWNGLTDEWHPTQMIADFMTLQEEFGHLGNDITLTFVGDGRNNVAHSLLVAGTMLGVNVHIVAPKELQPASDVIEIAEKYAKETGAKPMITSDVDEGVKGSNALYADVWVSMGEDNWEERLNLLGDYQINAEMMAKTGRKDTILMHCLPAYHDMNTKMAKEAHENFPGLVGEDGIEVTNEVFESAQGRQFEEAENRKHSIKAIMVATLGDVSMYPKA